MFEFENLIVYKKAKNVQQKIYRLVLNDRKIHSYIKDQIIRASVSIVINIAEGTGKTLLQVELIIIQFLAGRFLSVFH